MLTQFVLPSGESGADIDKTVDSLSKIGVDHQIVPVSGWRDINNYTKKDIWFSVFWDNEYIDEALREAIPVFLQFPTIEILILYKKKKLVVTEATWRYRIFRSHIYLVDDCRPVCLWVNKEAILDGWVREHDYSG